MKHAGLRIAITAVFLAGISGVAGAQGLLDKAKGVAKKTSIGQRVSQLGTEAQMLDATSVDLEEKNLPPIDVGPLKLGVSGVDIKNREAVRIRLFLYNPANADASVPLPPADLFILIDEKGRRLTMLGSPSVKNLTAGATEITVPGMERVEMSLLFNEMAADAKLGTLKVGTTGTITGIPINTASAGAAANGQASASPWKK